MPLSNIENSLTQVHMTSCFGAIVTKKIFLGVGLFPRKLQAESSCKLRHLDMHQWCEFRSLLLFCHFKALLVSLVHVHSKIYQK